MKRCSKCGLTKPISEFHKHKRMKDGHSRVCKPCACAVTAEWYKNHRERSLSAVSEWRKKNRDWIHNNTREYYQKNKDKILRWMSEYHNRNPERDNARTAEWRRNNRNKMREYSHKRYALQFGQAEHFTDGEFKSICEKHGNKCLCCGRADVKLTADHVVPLIKGGADTIDNIQPLCHSCNSRKKDKFIDYRIENSNAPRSQSIHLEKCE